MCVVYMIVLFAHAFSSHRETTLVQESVGHKRRSRSGSRNGTPAVKTPGSLITDLDGPHDSSELDEDILAGTALENQAEATLHVPEGPQQGDVSQAVEPTLDGLPGGNPLPPSLGVEAKSQNEDLQEGPAAEPSEPALSGQTAEVPGNSSAVALGVVSAPAETEERAVVEEGQPASERAPDGVLLGANVATSAELPDLPDGEPLVASISMAEDDFVRSILLSQPADADAAEVTGSVPMEGAGTETAVGAALDTSGVLVSADVDINDQLAVDAPMKDVSGSAPLGSWAVNTEGLTQTPNPMARPGPGLQAPACTPATAAGNLLL
jgi:hypothetical protein